MNEKVIRTVVDLRQSMSHLFKVLRVIEMFIIQHILVHYLYIHLLKILKSIYDSAHFVLYKYSFNS